MLEHIHLTRWDETVAKEAQHRAIDALEAGKIVYLPLLPFSILDHERILLSPDLCNGKSKNVSFDITTGAIRGTKCAGAQKEILQALMQRYAEYSQSLLCNIFPSYEPFAKQARTSFRPVEIAGRKAPSYRKDDTLLHIDAFPGNPVKGNRILRVFTNVNPEHKPRVWRVGEELDQVINRFAPQIKKPIPGSAYVQKLLNITKDYRTPYDHYMLKIHHTMKGDRDYQKNVSQQEIQFPTGSTWIVYTDQVSHAAMAGQHVFEQTFYLPVAGLQRPNTAPLKVLEKFLQRELV